jgi:putative membrane protein
MDALLKIIILSGFALFFAIIIQNGRIQLYVNPRIVPYVKFGIIVMMIIAIFLIRDIFKPKRKVNFTPYLFFLVPLLMAFLLPAKTIDSKSMAFGDINLTQRQNSNTGKTAIAGNSADTGNSGSSSDYSAGTSEADINTLDDNDVIIEDSSQSSDSLSPGQADTDQREEGLQLEGDTIVVSDNNFVQWLQEIYDNQGKYEGKKIQVIGFVFKSKEFTENEFVPARLMMACCTADLQPIGFLCRYDKASKLKNDTWLKVTGTIKVVDYKGQKTPVIIADKAENTTKPENEYVYPY